MRRVLAVIIFVFMAQSTVTAQDYAASFLNIGVGARGLGMGGALVALSDDVNAFFWNPAGLGLITQKQAAGMYGPQFGSLQDPLATFHHFGVAFPMPRGAVVAINWVRLAVEDIPIYSELRGNSFWDRFHDPSLRPTGTPEGSMADVEDALFFSFALNNKKIFDLGWDFHKIDVDIPLGVTLKWYRQKIGEHSASGLGIDAGAMIRFSLGEFFGTQRLGRMAFGCKLQDLVGSKLTWDTRHQDAIPLNFRIGFSYTHQLHWADSRISIAYDHESRFTGLNHWGVEWRGFNFLSLRAGINSKEFTCGAGFFIWKIQADYAFLRHELDALHRISCQIRL
ncbi:hypothetical protein KAR48_13205 [bacterium]|nr:hypothetical protein [bacterium]